ncbi:MAG TPA: hypothetical protein ENN30_02845 [Candidatus Woesearchaeota archaeon]|nr:hypothetical protein [Candidatus Woesearchaeota archaeon]
MKKSEKKGISAYKVAIVIISAVLISVSSTSLIYSSWKIVNYREFDMKIEVVEEGRIGFNLDPGIFNFGKVPTGATSKRGAEVHQDYSYPVLVRIEASGSIKKMVFIPENYFILEPNITKEIEILVFVPQDQKTGNYSGKLKVYFERP